MFEGGIGNFSHYKCEIAGRRSHFSLRKCEICPCTIREPDLIYQIHYLITALFAYFVKSSTVAEFDGKKINFYI